MITTESLELTGEYRFFSTRVEKMLFGIAVIIALVYAVVDFFIVSLFFTPGYRYVIYLAYLYPVTILLVTGIHYFVKRSRPKRLYIYNIASLAIFITLHFFPFFHDKDFSLKMLLINLLFQILIFGPFIVLQTLILWSFELKRKNILIEKDKIYPVKYKALRTPFIFQICCISIFMLAFYYFQSPFMFICMCFLLYESWMFFRRKIRLIRVAPDGLQLITSDYVTSLPYQDIARMYLQKGFLNVKKVLGAVFVTEKGFSLSVNQSIENYQVLVKLIISNCSHLDAGITGKLLQDFQTANA